MDKKIILEFRKKFGKYHPVFPKSIKSFFGTFIDVLKVESQTYSPKLPNDFSFSSFGTKTTSEAFSERLSDSSDTQVDR